METVLTSNNGVSEASVSGKEFYSPGLLATYCIVANLPFGIFLFGLNVYRRGQTTAGRITMAVCSLAILAETVALALDIKIVNLPVFLLNVVVGLGLMKSERTRYEKAIAAGARPAKWWPPILFLIANVIAVYLLSELLAYHSESAN